MKDKLSECSLFLSKQYSYRLNLRVSGIITNDLLAESCHNDINHIKMNRNMLCFLIMIKYSHLWLELLKYRRTCSLNSGMATEGINPKITDIQFSLNATSCKCKSERREMVREEIFLLYNT